MECKNCGAENIEHAIFCAKCGTRIDGKRACPSCGKLNAEENVYCNFCGIRLDGKTVCSSCGTAYLGNFCPQCGAKHKESAAAESRALPQRSAGVLAIIRNSLLFGSIVAMLIFSFFLGVSLSLDGKNWETSSAFYFIFNGWKDISVFFESLGTDIAIYSEAYFAVYMPSILIAVVYGANIIVNIVYATLATVSFSKNIGRKEFSLRKYLIPVAVTTLAAIIVPTILLFSLSKSASTQNLNLLVTISSPAIAEIVLVCVFLAAAIVMECILNGRKILADLRKIIPFGITAILLIVSLKILGTSFLNLSGKGTRVYYSAGAFLSSFLLLYGASSEVTPEEFKFINTCIAEYIIMAILIALLVLALYFILKALFSDKRSAILPILFTSLCVVLSVVFLALSVSLKTQISAQTVEGAAFGLGAAPVAALVLCLFALAGAITAVILFNRKSSGDRLETLPEDAE